MVQDFQQGVLNGPQITFCSTNGPVSDQRELLRLHGHYNLCMILSYVCQFQLLVDSSPRQYFQIVQSETMLSDCAVRDNACG